MNNSRLIFKNIYGTENDLLYSLSSSDDCVQIDCDPTSSTSGELAHMSSPLNVNIVRAPPAFHLQAPPDPLALLGLNELHSLGLYSAAKAKNSENFLVHLLNAPNKIEQCVDLRLQMSAFGLKNKYDLKTSTGSNSNNNNYNKNNMNKQISISNRKTSKTSTTQSSNAFFNPTTSYSIQSPISTSNLSNNNNNNNNMVHFVLLSFMSLFCLLLILVLIYFLIQRNKMQKKALDQHNSSLTSPHNQFEPLEHLYHQHRTLKKDPTTLERNQAYNMNQLQHFLLKQQLQNDMNTSRPYATVTNNACNLPISTSLLTFDWLTLAKQQPPNSAHNQSIYAPNDIIDSNTKKKLVKKYSDISRKSNSINQQTEMKLLQQPLLDTAAVANSTLSTRATVTASSSSSSSSSSSVSSSINKNESVNQYQKLYPKMLNQANDSFLNYSLAAPNDINSTYNNLLIQNLYSGTLLNNAANKANGYNKVALLCNTNDPNAPPQLIKIMNLNPEVNCDCIQMINLDANLNHSHLLFETNHYENYRNLPNTANKSSNTAKRFSQIVESSSNKTAPTNLDNTTHNTNNTEQFYELIDDNILSSNLTSNNYCEWTDKNKANLVRRNSTNLTSSFNSTTKRKYPKTNPNYSQSNYVTIKNNLSN